MSDVHSTEESPPSGFRLGRYELILKIGSGGVGQVYLARTSSVGGFERLFAIKMIHPHLSSHSSFSEALIREAQLASSIRHRNTVAVFDIGSHDNFHFLVMEYIEGCSLTELCQANRTFRPPNLLGPIMLDALYGLQAAHELQDDAGRAVGLIHRDFSPPNLLVGTDGTCRVTDFGIARTDTLSNVTNPGIIKGKPSYMAPEQVTGGEIDQRTDVFAAGIVLWNSLTGKRLFDGPSEASTLYNVLRRNIPNASEIGLRPDSVFDPILMKALQRQPELRFQTAGEMAEALRDALLKVGMLGSTQDVGAWVSESFRSRLEARHKRIRSTEAAKVRAGSRSHSERLTHSHALNVVPKSGVNDRNISPLGTDSGFLTPPETNQSWTSMVRSATPTSQQYIREELLGGQRVSPAVSGRFYTGHSSPGEHHLTGMGAVQRRESSLLVIAVAAICAILITGWWIYDREPVWLEASSDEKSNVSTID